ncbi:hypothetical protein ASF08_07780 [Methylobacterium sp. Leaf85]|nr:hypothetical protein ASF08_07780 [Methylobacterium sp. Leaf85]
MTKTPIGPCKGATKLDASGCPFDALITPEGSWKADGAGGLGTGMVIFSEEIDLYAQHVAARTLQAT